jgi:hypothetical protein
MAGGFVRKEYGMGYGTVKNMVPVSLYFFSFFLMTGCRITTLQAYS